MKDALLYLCLIIMQFRADVESDWLSAPLQPFVGFAWCDAETKFGVILSC
jgi:hypothetical protein